MPLTTLKASNFVDDSVTIGKMSASGTASSSTYLRGDNSWQDLAGLSGLYSASTTTNYTVTVAGSKFVMDGVSQGTISLVEGYTAVFDVSDNSVATHILRFATAADAAGSTEYTTGVKAMGTPGSAGAKVFFTVPIGAPGLFYYCTAHSSMGGTANTTTAPTKTVGDMWVTGGRIGLAFSSATGPGVWSTQTVYPAAQYNARAGGGTGTAAITGGGETGASTEQDDCYSWDGLTWAVASSLNTARNSEAGAGSQSAGLTMGGDTNGSGTQMATCEEYDGSSWAASNSLNQGSVRASYGSGSQTAALNVGGWGNYPGPLGRSECAEYDGTSWTTGGVTTYSARNMSISGNSSAATGTGGATGGSGGVTTTNTYDGSTWSSAPGSATSAEGGVSTGTQSATIYNGGYIASPYGATAVTQEFNGSAWSTSNAPLKATGWSAGIGTSSTMVNISGQAGSPGVKLADVYEFDKPVTEFPVA